MKINQPPCVVAVKRQAQIACAGFFIIATAVTAHAQNVRPAARLIASTDAAASQPVLVARYSMPDAPPVGNSNAESKSAPRRVVAREIAPVVERTTSAALASVNITSDERRLFDLINLERERINLPQLQWDAGLVEAARVHSSDMAHTGTLSHTGSDMSDAAIRVRNLGVRGWRALGENIAYNQGFDDPVAFAVERWMKSIKHRQNICNPTFTHSGIAVTRASDGTIFFTQVFVQR